MAQDTVKAMNYNMSAKVVEALEKIMQDEGYKTMTKAINECILDRKRLIDALREEESASNKLYHAKMAIENEMTKMVQFLEYLKKHTKTS